MALVFHKIGSVEIKMVCCVDSVLSIEVKFKVVNCRNSLN